jgi:hypothetical protein
MDDPYVERDPIVVRFSPANWAVWRLMPKAALWEAAALSLDIEPLPTVLWLRDSRAIGPEAHRARELSDRVKVLLRNVGEGEAIPSVDGYGWEQVVRLSDVSVWANGAGVHLPDGFPAAEPAAFAASSGGDPPAAETVQALAVGNASPFAPAAIDAKPATWWDAVLPYLAAMLKAGRYATAKEMYKAVEMRADSEGSPFGRGTGEHRGTLLVLDFKQPMGLKTLQNRWKELRQAAASQ